MYSQSNLRDAVWPNDVIRKIMLHFAERHRVHPSFAWYQMNQRVYDGWACVLAELTGELTGEKHFRCMRESCDHNKVLMYYYHMRSLLERNKLILRNHDGLMIIQVPSIREKFRGYAYNHTSGAYELDTSY